MKLNDAAGEKYVHVERSALPAPEPPTSPEELEARWAGRRKVAWRVFQSARAQGDSEQRAVERIVESVFNGELYVWGVMEQSQEATKELRARELEGENLTGLDIHSPLRAALPAEQDPRMVNIEGEADYERPAEHAPPDPSAYTRLEALVSEYTDSGECMECGAEVCRNVAHDVDCVIGRVATALEYSVDFGGSRLALAGRGDALELLRRFIEVDHGADGLQGTIAATRELLKVEAPAVPPREPPPDTLARQLGRLIELGPCACVAGEIAQRIGWQ